METTISLEVAEGEVENLVNEVGVHILENMLRPIAPVYAMTEIMRFESTLISAHH